LSSFNFLFPHLKSNGVYIIEDCGCNHLTGDDKDRKPFTSKERFLHHAYRMALQMNQAYASNSQTTSLFGSEHNFPATNLGFMLRSIEFIPNAIIIQKGENVPLDQIPAPAHYFF
jgi:hypothetical protein